MQKALEYKEWRNFELVIDKAKISCKNSGYVVDDNFVDVNKIVKTGISKKEIVDYKLTRYACYLVAQNGDVRKAIKSIGGTQYI